MLVLKKLIQINSKIKISIIAKGISMGNEIEFTDEATLAKSILDRTYY